MRAPCREIVARVEGVPGFGWRTFEAVDGDGPPTALRAEEHMLENEHLRVEVDPHSGMYTITTADGVVARGLGRLVEGGDGGDTYNYSPPADDIVIDTPEAVTVTCHEDGPVRAQLRVLTWYRWPHHAVGDERRCTRRSDEQILTEVVTTLELRAGERALRVRTELDHRCRDHRLRAHFPLPRTVTGSAADCAFAVVERGLTTEGGPHEAALPTFVSRRFVDASDGVEGLALVHDGLLEYELVGDGTELALTLLRATGYLSRSEMLLRPNPAGPLDPLDGPQLQGPVAVEYAVALHRGDWADRRPARSRRRRPRPARPDPHRRNREPTADRSTAAGPRRGHLGGAPRARWPGGAGLQPGRRGQHRGDRARRDTGTRLARRPPRPTGRALRGQFELRAAGIATAPPRPLTQLAPDTHALVAHLARVPQALGCVRRAGW